MEQSFTCPDCGRQTAYRPQECALLARYKTSGDTAQEYRYRLVHCPGCGKSHESPEQPPLTRKAGPHERPARR